MFRKRIINSLKSRIIIAVTGIVFASLAITTFFLVQRAKKELSNAIEGNALNLLEATKNHVSSQHSSILYHKEAMLSRRKSELKNNTIIALTVIESEYNRFRNGKQNNSIAKKNAIKTLQKLRYDNSVGYFWINDIKRPFPKMVMHPTIPELDGNILDDPKFNCALGKDENLFKAFVDVCLEKGDGYVDYLWEKPTTQGLSEQQPKISYVKLFYPWNWIIGTGVYIDDIEKDVQNRINAVINDLNKTIIKQRIGKNGYTFIFNDENKILVHPNRANTDGNLLINPSTGKLILNEIKNAATNSTSYMEYLWDKPGYEGEFRFHKKTYVTYYEPLNWYIGTTVYKEDFDQQMLKLTKPIILFSGSFLLLSIIISLIISRSITTPLNLLIQNVKKTDQYGIPANTLPETGSIETKALSSTINTMIETISKSKKELKEQRDFSLEIINGAPDIICGLSSDGTLTFINPTGENITGYGKDELIGRNWWNTMHTQKEYEQLQETIETTSNNEISEYEMILKCKNGKLKIIIWNYLIKRYSNNKVQEIIGFGNDITERKQAKEALIKQNTKYATLLQNLNGMVYHCDNDKDWTMKFVSEGCLKLTGYKVEDLIENKLISFNELIVPEFQDYVWDRLQECLINLEPYELEYQINSAEGTIKWVWERGCGIFNEQKELIHLEGFITDITERKQAEEALQKSEAQLRTLIETIPDLIWLKNPDGIYIACNPKFERFFGAKEAEIVGKTDYEFVQKELADFFTKNDKAAMQANKPTINEEEVTYADDGHKEILETIKTPLYDSNNQLLGVLGIARDITEHKRNLRKLKVRNEEYLALNEELQESLESIQKINKELIMAKEKAVESDNLKTAFLANMSHEIRTPLNGILGFIELLKRDKQITERQEKYIKVIDKSGNRMLNIINDLIDISKIETKQTELYYKETSVNKIIDEMYIFFKPEAEAKGLKLTFKKGVKSEKDIIHVDKTKLNQILSNLLDNAIKYTKKGQIAFGYTEKGNFLEFYVADTGVGISKQMQEAIFERFRQEDSTIRRGYEGMGLGLSISKAYVEMHGGKIWVESKPGEGSTFYFTLPC